MKRLNFLFLAMTLSGVTPAGARSSAAAGPHYSPAPAGLPFSSAVQIGDMLYMSGQIGLGADGKLVPGFEAQTRQTMDNIVAAAGKSGASANDIVKCTVMLSDMSNWAAFNRIYVTYFHSEHLPVRTAFGATGLAMGAALEVECWAYLPPR